MSRKFSQEAANPQAANRDAFLDLLIAYADGASGERLVAVGTALARLIAAASEAQRLAVLTSFSGINEADRGEAVGKLFLGENLTEGPVNPGEYLKVDALGPVTGWGFTPAAAAAALGGDPGELPQDLESYRTYREPTVVAVSGGAAEINLNTNPFARIEHDASFTLGFTELTAGNLGQKLNAGPEIKNTHGSNVITVTITTSGTGLADVLLHNGLESTFDLAAGETGVLYYSTLSSGELVLSRSVPT